MKRLLLFVGFFILLTPFLWAQQEDGARVVIPAQAVQANGVTIQVGVPFLGENRNASIRALSPIDVRFPWDVLYLFETFAETSFDVSKGYYSDKIRIDWELRNNFDLVSNIKIYRRQYTVEGNDSYEFVASVSSTTTSYEDKYTEGGVLYEYKVLADGILDGEVRYANFITGIGFRNPTATVTGNIVFEGGNPVEDVIVRATSNGNTSNYGAALKIPANGFADFRGISKPITTVATLQAWVKPLTAYTSATDNPISLFDIKGAGNHMVTVRYDPDNQKIVVDVAGNIFEIENYFPSGRLNTRGDDELVPVSGFNTAFTHISAVLQDGELPQLFVNGRPMTQEYVSSTHAALEGTTGYTMPFFGVRQTTTSPIDMQASANTEWDRVTVGGNMDAMVDEIRIWKSVLDAETIRKDYRRYISGNNADLISYTRANEGVGQYAYDLSRMGFTYNKNNARLWTTSTPVAERITWTSGLGNIPTAEQLGILGITDVNGNYEITSIPYSGTGESFKITPLFGQHQFEPGQQLVYLGQGSEVVNKIDFKDISSFVFKGKILYDSRNVFPSFVDANGGNFQGFSDGDEYVTGPGILDEGYNYFEKNGKKYSKGEYWLNDNGTPGNITDDYLERYARISPEGVNVYIDNQIVLDKNNVPVVTDANGNFEISVPIGNHYISVKKDKHDFVYAGRFPAEPGTFKEFFEDAVEQTVFVDTTKVVLVGKVVGGSVEAEKPIGFGADGLREESVNVNGTIQDVVVSSVNNIGQASIVLNYSPPGLTDGPYTRTRITTNEQSGEFRKKLLPLNYDIKEDTGITILSNSTLDLLDTNESVNLKEIPLTETPEFELPNGEMITGEPYHLYKPFVYRSTPVLRVTDQTSDELININDTDVISTEGFQYPVYSQFLTYKIDLMTFERYENLDSGTPVESLVPIIDGQLNITNNLALDDSEEIKRDDNDQSIIHYTFRAGLPSISPPFTRNIDIKYTINEVDYPAENYIKEGIILGGQSDGSQTFITAGPDIPEIILRDPPGSESSASIESGESITFNVNYDGAEGGGASEDIKIFGGVKASAGGGLAGPVIESQAVNTLNFGISAKATSKDGKSLTKTYTFNQTISTSDDIRFVGADGDLYIGYSKNYFYGKFDNVQSSENQINGAVDLVLENTAGEKAYISKQKAMFFVEEPSETFFVYSQKYILETVIPELELIISNIDNGIISENDPGVLTKDEYQQQIYLWRKTILENERKKYLALKDRSAIQEGIENQLDSYIEDITNVISDANVGVGYENALQNKIEQFEGLKTLLDEQFYKNVSFDDGVGEFSRSVETVVVNGDSYEYNVTVDESFALDLGFTFNKVGLVSTTSVFSNQDYNAALETEDTKTTTVNYTLKDGDRDNFLSVDVVNAFDGNGPIFSTVGGATSCPWEGEELSHFYNHSTYDPDNSVVEELPEDKREQLSFATQQVEVPRISVDVAEVFNVPETDAAEFTLLLENNSATELDIYFDIVVDNSTNPNSAIFNINQNGTEVFVPYGKTIEYKLTLQKSISDVYDYEDIDIYILSQCDPYNTYDYTTVSAHFVPSCSKVSVLAPLENWTYNRDIAFNTDGTTKPMNINLGNYSTVFNGFKKIDLEYRLASAPTWNRLQTYYTSQAFYDEADAAGEDEITLITDATVTYPFDIVALQLNDGEYEIRARSTCTNGTEYISQPIKGRIDLSSPRRFGTPQPIDGILGAGEDLLARFNENIFYNSAVSSIEITGQTNQLPINHEVSVYFEGQDNTMTIETPMVTDGDFTLEFWMNNATTSAQAVIAKQQGGFEIKLDGPDIVFTYGDKTARGAISRDGLFHHYTFSLDNAGGELIVYEDDRVVGEGSGMVNSLNGSNNPIILGGNSFKGNINELRLWHKALSLEDAYAAMYDKLQGNESGLIGYWPMTEGHGSIANDLARFKNAIITASWDIKPKGNSYDFKNGQYQLLDNTSFVQLTPTMDASITFWMKTATAQQATLFSNGKGDGTDVIQPGGYANKWAINMTSSGKLEFASEGKSYVVSPQNMADDQWHHVAILINRLGSMTTYLDDKQVSSHPVADIGGFSGNKVWLGARGSTDLAGIVTVDREFTGKIDEFRLWNTLRNRDQVSRDRYNEMDFETTGLLLYAKMNQQDPPTANGPRYYHAFSNNSVIPSNAVLSSGAVSYSDDAPPIKPARDLINFQVNHVINQDEVILEPVINNWAEVEGQILDITVHRMFDSANNMQQSPITWTAFVQKNDVDWFVDGYPEDIIELIQQSGESQTFQVTLVNRGGQNQPYTIQNIPSWLSLSRSSGVLPPSSQVNITATVDASLAIGEYEQDLHLQTDFGYDQRLLLQLRVLGDEPDWAVNPEDFEYNMNVIGKVRVDGEFSEDVYDMVGAFVGDEVRGSAHLVYDENYQQYFAFLTVYAHTATGEDVSFKLWDASRGEIVYVSLNASALEPFMADKILGSLNAPAIFENSGLVEQKVHFNRGWTWLSLNVNDPLFNDLNTLTAGMTLATSDRFMSSSPSYLETYYNDAGQPQNSTWSGTISANGGLMPTHMYKAYMATSQDLDLVGPAVDMPSWSFSIKQNWNWLPYPLRSNNTVGEALSSFAATEGDVIKSQNKFAIYDALNGWSGTLQYLEAGKGYMLKSATPQEFVYPSFLGREMQRLPYGENQPDEFSLNAMEHNMNVVALLPEGYSILYAYDKDGVLKGRATNQGVGELQLSFLTIFGDKVEDMQFYLSSPGDDPIPVDMHFDFVPNKVWGTVIDPVLINLSSLAVEEMGITGTYVYPNPFDEGFDLSMHSVMEREIEVSLYSVVGQLIKTDKFSAKAGKNTFSISPQVMAGTYFLKIRTGDRETTMKIVKR